MSTIDDTLNARDIRYGAFYDNAHIAQNIKFVLRMSPNWSKLEPDQKEALEQICSKVGRMMTGDFNYVDSWHDIGGYAKLVENRLIGLNEARKTPPVDNAHVAPGCEQFANVPSVWTDGAITPSGWADANTQINPGDKITIGKPADGYGVVSKETRAAKQDAATKKRQESY
jgi:hypothetical protein